MPNLDFGTINKKINGGSVSPLRTSKWNASTSDQDSLEKATKLKAHKNLDYPSDKGNKIQPSSFNTLDDSTLLASTSSLGIVLGASAQEVSLSLSSLRDLESQRLSERDFSLNHVSTILDETSTVCSLDENLDLQSLNLICSEVAEDLGDGAVTLYVYRPPYHNSKRKKVRVGRKGKMV
jgi:hypothetical protein